MNSRSKIIGLTRQLPEPDVEDVAPDALIEVPEQPEDQEEAAHSADDDADYGDNPPRREFAKYVVPALLIMAFAGWTGFFGWTYFPEAMRGLANDRVISLIAIWAVPALLFAVLWLVAMRSSSREASRFGDVALLLRRESDALALRMRTVNEEISLAREFLAQNARDLETVGRQSSRQLVESAELLASALADSDEKAKTLETVSNAANTNLEQLRKHLPVVTSAAKDVTNQIGGAGNSAQMQIKALIASLERVGAAGKSAREYIDNMEIRANDVGDKLEQSLSHSAALLDERSADAANRAAEMATMMDRATKGLTTGVAAASSELDAILVQSHEKVDAKLLALRESLSELSGQSADEEARILRIIGEIAAHIESSATRISEVDKSATDQTAKLAFAVSALGESTKDVGAALTNNKNITQNLIAQSDKLLASLGSANREIDEVLPTAMLQLSERVAVGITQLDQATSSAESLDQLSDNMLAKLTSLEHLIDVQRTTVSKLMSESDEHFASRHEQADALGVALTQTRSLIEEMTEDANTKLVASMLRVRETTRQAAESSRKILDEELANVAEQLTDQNKAALAEAIDVQIAAMNDVVKDAIERNIALSESAVTKVTAQLGQLDELTTNLEQRIANSKDGFEAIDDDSFARRMVLLTESLNSTSIDVAKILSNDVTDTAWAAYLKGDRGVFTRRAVRLLDAGEARVIAAHYGDDNEFREHVNRYIHDFESMMRVLLSTRDGNAIGVTLLSSDVGKLYVALAQAIERLRN
jgi:hypothetical protein